MTTNTIRHVSDESVYKIFNPAGTSFPSNITNVQAALAALNPIAINGIPNATQTIIGISRFASQEEVDSGILNNVSVSPSTLKSAILRPPATTTVAGLTRYATTSEALAGAVDNAAVVPTGLKASVDTAKSQILSTQATELSLGLAKISTQAAALAGADDLTIMTPRKVALAIGKAIATVPSYSNATESNYGLVRMAAAGEVQAGNVGGPVAVSPASLKTLISTTYRNGLISIATGDEVSAGYDNTKAITPATLLYRTGNEGRIGLLKTTRTVGWGDGSTALAYNANVISTQGNQTINGGLTLTGLQVNGYANITSSMTVSGNLNLPTGNLDVAGGITSRGNQVVTVDMIGDDVPVGVIVMWIGEAHKVPPKWRICDGGYTYSPASNPALWYVLPTGRVPDMRGLFVRGAGVGADILNAQSPDSKGKPGLGVGCGAGGVGTVQPQAVKKHKHITAWGESNRSYGYFGSTVIGGKYGSKKTDGDNYQFFTNDGEETEPENIRDSFGTMNPKNLMQDETRPWNIAVYYIIKIQ